MRCSIASSRTKRRRKNHTAVGAATKGPSSDYHRLAFPAHPALNQETKWNAWEILDPKEQHLGKKKTAPQRTGHCLSLPTLKARPTNM
mmetsp:Transcript_2803/g.6770  ORF Transcript_2803/g.6770 Transcript_2803/m.6770 type:complete len:88 (-) Transcript_2803:600-863(-)